MLNWLKFISGSIVLDRDAKEASQRKFWNVLFFLFVTLILLSFFFSTGYNLAFKYHYNHSTAYQNAVVAALKYEDENVANCKIDSEKLSCYDQDGNDVYLPKPLALFESNGYEVIIDPRDQATHINFSASYVNKNNKEDIIPHMTYLSLTNEEKKNYKFHDVVYEYIDLDYATYLPIIESYYAELDENDSKRVAYDKIVTNEKLKENEINVQKWDLFVKHALPDLYLSSYEKAPVLMSYYTYEYNKLNKDKEYGYEHDHCIIFLQEIVSTSFVTNKGVFVNYEAGYRKVPSFTFHPKKIADNASKMKEHARDFVYDVYSDISSTQTLNYLINIFRYMPFIIIVMLLLSLFMFILTRMSSDDYAGYKYVGCFKIVSACTLGATLVAGIIGFIIQFFFNQGVAFAIAISVFTSMLILRVILLTIISFVRRRRELKRSKNAPASSEKMELL